VIDGKEEEMGNTRRIMARLRAGRPVFRRYGVTRLALFGSATRGTIRRNSDLDFLVESDRPTFDSCMGVREYLEDAFRRKVDLVVSGSVKPRLRARILSTAVDVPGLSRLQEQSSGFRKAGTRRSFN
jgi:hypothetical protein